MSRGRVGLFVCIALAAVLGTPAVAAAGDGAWSWHLSAGAVSKAGAAFTGTVWAGSPTFEELFLRMGITTGGSSTAVEAGVAYVLTPLAPSLAARFPDLDPYLAAAMTVDLADGRIGAYGGAGATFRVADRTWAWGEVRLGSSTALVIGLGVSL